MYGTRRRRARVPARAVRRGRAVSLLSVVALLIGAVTFAGEAPAAAAPSPDTAGPSAQSFVCDGQWHPVPSVDPQHDYGDYDSIVSVSSLSASDAWGIGYARDFSQPGGYQTLAEHWDGTSWSAVAMPNSTKANWNQLAAVTAVATDDVWAVGSEGSGPYASLIEHWDGSSWTIQSDGVPDSYLTSVSAHGPNDVWVAGSTNYIGSGLLMHWDGAQWTRTLIPGALLFRAIDERAPNDIWAVGQESVNGYGDVSLAYHYNGRTWRRYDTPNPLGKYDIDQNWLTSVDAISTRDVWATGVARDSDWGIADRPFTAHWNGRRWAFVATPDPGGSTQSTDLWGAVAFGPSDIWALGRVGRDPRWTTFGTHWDGSSWTETSPSTSGEFLGVGSDGAGGLWGVGDHDSTTYNGVSTLVEHLCPADGTNAQSGTRSAAPAAQSSPAAHPNRRLCAAPAKTGYAGCFAVMRTDKNGPAGVQPNAAPSGYGPADLQSAYRLPSSAAGSGQTVAIVDAFDDPNAAADLATYRSQYGLPPCTEDTGCFRKVDQRGGTTYPAPDGGWAGEISLDLDMVSAACPNCHILLVESDDNSLLNLGASVNEAVALGARFVSNSYGGSEDAAETSWDTTYFDHPGVAITASSGDYGYGVEYPAASQFVTSVGGTSLVHDTSSRGWSETVWSNDSGAPGSGCSAFDPKPTWQTDSGCANRAVADVSAVADPETGVAVYDSFGAPGWGVFGGTSASSPIVAGTYALAGAPPASSQPNAFPYATTNAFNDVTSGNNGTCTPDYLCTAGAGYDGPSGLGTPNGIAGFAPHGPHGDIAGIVTDEATHAPIAGAQVTAGGQLTVTDASGRYDLFIPTGSYAVTASNYGYRSQTVRGVSVTQDHATTADFALAALPTHSVSGTVTDGSGHGWPLYAQIAVDGKPGGPVWTDPVTGHYSVDLPEGATYTLHVAANYPGYQAKDIDVRVRTTDVVADVLLPVDANTCSAPGYAYHYAGGTQTFDSTQAPTGWSTGSAANGAGWVFDDPGSQGNTTGGTGNFAMVDSDHDGFATTEDATLVSPTMNLEADATPVVQFAQDFFDGYHDTTTIDVSTNDGHSWKTVATQNASAGGPTQTAIPIPQAAHKAHVRIRFHYQTQSWTWWWKLDDVFIGNRSCDAAAGDGLLVGTVTAAGTNEPIDGATITNNDRPNEVATTAPTGDPGMPGGFYWMLTAQAGNQSFTAAANGYQSQTQNLTVRPNVTTRADFTLIPS